MGKGRQKDFYKRNLRSEFSQWCAVSLGIKTRIRRGRKRLKPLFYYAIQKVLELHGELNNLELLHNSLRCISFETDFIQMSSGRCLAIFRFEKQDIPRIQTAIAWPEERRATERNGFRVSSLLVTCIILYRLSRPNTWNDAAYIFGKRPEVLSEIFWEGIEVFIAARSIMIEGPLNSTFLNDRVLLYAEAINQKCQSLPSCMAHCFE